MSVDGKVDYTYRMQGESIGEMPLGKYVKDLTGYLPMDCPVCGRHRLMYGQDDTGAVIVVTCEKCNAWWPDE